MLNSASGIGSNGGQLQHKAWIYQLNRYQWFVLIVCTLGWVFDCMDQQLFALVRKSAIAALQGMAPDAPAVDNYSGIATSFMLIGWATGGIFFGILGDKMGRAKTMVLTILTYSLFTCLSGFAQSYWEFIAYRFLCGLGIGGQFAVGVTLVAEYMPDRVRPRALALLQALANCGNMTAAFIGMGFAHLESTNSVSEAWRWTLAIGAIPALLAIPVFRSLKEPESWTKAVGDCPDFCVNKNGTVPFRPQDEKRKKAGSLKELFGNPRWRRNTIVGMILASTGVIGLWGIGFFSIDLNQTVFRKIYEAKEREAGEAEKDRVFIAQIVGFPKEAADFIAKIKPKNMLSQEADQKDAQQIFTAIVDLRQSDKELSKENVIALVEKNFPLPEAQAQKRQARLANYFIQPDSNSILGFQEQVERITARTKKLNGQVGKWASITSILFNIGGFLGAYSFSYVTGSLGRRKAFALSFMLAGTSTCMAFLLMKNAFDVLWMTPLMGFCQFLIFGGYAVYFPELYPTRLRSTGVSFCYNIGRYVAALGPFTLGLLSSEVFKNQPEPMRYAGATMCAIFLVGLLTLPFAPETKDQPLPE
jgi:MFS family permease